MPWLAKALFGTSEACGRTHPTADDDNFRVEDMQQAGHPQPNDPARAFDNRQRQRIPQRRCLADDTPADLLQIAINHLAYQRLFTVGDFFAGFESFVEEALPHNGVKG